MTYEELKKASGWEPKPTKYSEILGSYEAAVGAVRTMFPAN
jgi:hypothetical protein